MHVIGPLCVFQEDNDYLCAHCFSRTISDGMESNDTFAIQPFASQPVLTNASSSFLSTTPPTNASLAGPSGVAQSISVAPTTSPQLQPLGGGANPYRMGTGMAARKPAYGTSGIASYTGGSGVGSLLTSQSTMAGPVFSPEMPSMLVQQPSLQPQPQVQWQSSLDMQCALLVCLTVSCKNWRLFHCDRIATFKVPCCRTSGAHFDAYMNHESCSRP